MKTLIKNFLVETLSLYFASYFISGLIFNNGYVTMAFAGLGLMVVSSVVKPVINILLLPINLITFGLFKWVGIVVALYLVTLIVPGFKILNFVFSGIDTYWFYLPPVNLAGFGAIVAFSFIIYIFSSIIGWVIK